MSNTSLTCRQLILKKLRTTGIHYHACVRQAVCLRLCVSACGWGGKNKYVCLQSERLGCIIKALKCEKNVLPSPGNFSRMNKSNLKTGLFKSSTWTLEKDLALYQNLENRSLLLWPAAHVVKTVPSPWQQGPERPQLSMSGSIAQARWADTGSCQPTSIRAVLDWWVVTQNGSWVCSKLND